MLLHDNRRASLFQKYFLWKVKVWFDLKNYFCEIKPNIVPILD